MTCLEYVESKWRHFGRKLLQDIIDLYRTTQETVKNITSVDSQLINLIEALDWLCRAIRDPSQETHDNYVISDHFSSSSSGKGLEMSLDLMMSLAGVEYPVIVNGGMVFVGYNTVLVPTEIHEDYVQFHVYINAHQQINPFTLEYGPRVLCTDCTAFQSKRCFLGWCEVAHIKLGTQALPATVKYSPASEKPKTLHLTGISTGFRAASAFPLQAGINGQATFSFLSYRLYFTPTSSYSKMLWDASKQVTLVCDVTAQRSWLVPKLSLLIHMAHIWFKENSLLKDGILDPIPFAEPHDNGKLLVEVFQGHGDAVICGCDNDALRLRSLLLGFNINLLATVNLTERCTSKHLYGFEFMDVVLEPGKGAVMKKTKIKKSGNWLALANLADAIIFCSDLGEAMAPADVSSRKNSCCNSLPLGNDYLAAHVSCLDELANRSGRQQLAAHLSSRIVLSQRNSWNISGDPFGACSHDSSSTDTCWNRVNMLQKVCGKDFFQDRIGKPKRNESATSTKLSLKGAVVFGEASSGE
ncbi:hypothetical protein K469DRAFT_798170 [Zopfia rhizophila CBS 207.26]|uniref:Uncharacterized protein n=1 Tax=Zopfia rhizophila CBS 207.26 TaxID=1314779 RepID=A0A6A6DP49_9PEZI|nr:hypothetical protein K469DRAFT_798170 [Zopfia rhizophila CBS 207.26]